MINNTVAKQANKVGLLRYACIHSTEHTHSLWQKGTLEQTLVYTLRRARREGKMEGGKTNTRG